MNDVKQPAKQATPVAADDARLRRPNRDDPHSDRRAGEGREFSNRDWSEANAPTDPERRRAFRERWAQTHLPNLPKKDGWHRMWCSTSHPTDTVARRVALGYRVVMLDEIKDTAGWTPEQSSVKDGATIDGAVRWREMIALEIPEDMYQEYMREFHHDAPLDMQRGIVGGLQQTGENIRDAGGRVELGDGFENMSRFVRAPR